ncbi:MAG TPA: EamA family transporter, partial [Candidatus Synoicihabitans sp.]|nr:EamA family transporter [Candidatus Synoicihabitans sp.]
MTALALLLVLLAAVIHATWNLAAKRAGGGLPWVFLAGLIINVLYVPVLVIHGLVWQPRLAPAMILPILVSALLKGGYALTLQRAYRSGDFSLIYPLARGTGPLLATVGAVLFLGERPTWLGTTGAVLIIASIFLLTGGERLWQRRRAADESTAPHPPLALAVRFGLLTGVFIASYTVWDRYA